MKNQISSTPPEPRKSSFWGEILKTVSITLAIVIPIRYFIAQPFIVSGNSMHPNFESGEYLVIDEISYRLGEPKRGDVIVFRYPNNPKVFYIKRIIGLPGETVKIVGEKIYITTAAGEEFLLDEKYDFQPFPGNFSKTLGPDEYYVLGDNRPASSDSRVWGALSRNFIIGKPIIRLLPISKISLFPGQQRHE
jgi:signal peptidase I